jgi:carbonic anhydrase
VPERRITGAVLRRLRHDLEHVRHARPVPGLRAQVAVDIVPALRAVVAARGLVRGGTLTHDGIQQLLDNNRRWATSRVQQDPEFFARLTRQQAPAYLWIGCSDSRVPANEIVGLQPGELFVHRNVANVVVHADLNCLSVLQYAVEVLRVRHVIVCGHYGCGGVRAAYERAKFGLIDNWLLHVHDVRVKHARAIDLIADADAAADRLCELNVIEQAANVCATTIVRDAWDRGQALTVHALIYRLSDGLLRTLGFAASSPRELEETYAAAVKAIGPKGLAAV